MKRGAMTESGLPERWGAKDLLHGIHQLGDRISKEEFDGLMERATEALRTARDDGLKEAAALLDNQANAHQAGLVVAIIRAGAVAIRALKDKP